MILDEKLEKHTSVAKAIVVSAGFIPGINSRPTNRTSFSAACLASEGCVSGARLEIRAVFRGLFIRRATERQRAPRNGRPFA